jgi:hypothetical protein
MWSSQIVFQSFHGRTNWYVYETFWELPIAVRATFLSLLSFCVVYIKFPSKKKQPFFLSLFFFFNQPELAWKQSHNLSQNQWNQEWCNDEILDCRLQDWILRRKANFSLLAVKLDHRILGVMDHLFLLVQVSEPPFIRNSWEWESNNHRCTSFPHPAAFLEIVGEKKKKSRTAWPSVYFENRKQGEGKTRSSRGSQINGFK